MSAQLIAAYGPLALIPGSYWLKLEQDGLPDDSATIGEAADLLDTLYDRNPCIDPPPEGGEEPPVDEEGNLEPPVDEQQYWDVVHTRLSFAACDSAGCDILLLRVYRSHPAEPYKLIFDNGEQQGITILNERRKQVVTISAARYADLDYPVQGDFRYLWSSVADATGATLQPPTVTVDGARLVFPRTVTGILLTEYNSGYDLIEIKVPRDTDNKPGKCQVTGLYAGEIYGLELTPPEVDESMDSVAKRLACSGQTIIDVPDKPYSCYERVYHRVLCRCSGKNSGQGYTTEEDVPCPDTWDDIPPGRHQVGSRSVLEKYVPCSGEEVLTAEDVDKHLDVCCVEGTPPPCDTLYAVYQGGRGYDLEAARREYGDSVQLVPVGPKSGVCGQWKTRFVKPHYNCCDGVIPLQSHPDNPSEMAPGSQARLCVLNGLVGELLWTVNAPFTFTNGLQQYRSGALDRCATIYAPALTCARATVSVDDTCDVLTITVRVDGVAPVAVTPAEITLSPGGQAILEVSGGVGPYTWEVSGGVIVLWAGDPMIAIEAPLDFCGTATVTATDFCGESVTARIKSTSGYWRAVDFDPCSSPVTGVATTGSLIQDSRYAVSFDNYNSVVPGLVEDDAAGHPCPGLFFADIGTEDSWCNESEPVQICPLDLGGPYSVTKLSNTRCYAVGCGGQPGSWSLKNETYVRSQKVTALLEWSCND